MQCSGDRLPSAVIEEDALVGLARDLAAIVERIALLPRHQEIAPALPLMTIEEVMADLSIGRTLAQELIDNGDIPVIEITGRALRIDREDLQAYKKRRRVRRGCN